MRLKFLSPDQILSLNKEAKYLPTLLILVDWAIIFSIAWLCSHFFSFYSYIAAVIVIGVRQHALMVMMHDAAHLSLAPSKKWNDFMGDAFCAWPFFISLRDYRRRHMAHHLFANSNDDPDFLRERFPRTRRELLSTLVRDALGLSALAQITKVFETRGQLPVSYRMRQVTYYATAAVVIGFGHLWRPFMLFWIVPRLTWVNIALRIRAVADHAGTQHLPRPYDVRSVEASVWDRLLWAPHHCSYHIGHHLYPRVPCFRLKGLHKKLMESPEFREHARVCRGFRGLWKDLPSNLDAVSGIETITGLTFTQPLPEKHALA